MVAFAANDFAVDLSFWEVCTAAGSDDRQLSPSSMMIGMGLLLVRCWCTCLVVLITLGAVGSFDVGAEIGLGVVMPFTLGGCIASTL